MIYFRFLIALLLILPVLTPIRGDCEEVCSTRKSLEGYLLPKENPLHEQLTQLLSTPSMFHSLKSFTREGFDVKIGHRELMVGVHPSNKGYVIKKFTDEISKRKQLKNYIQRIKGARKLRQIIQDQGFEYLVVPQKWLYHLPPPHPKNSFVLVAENMDVYDWEDPAGDLKKLYYLMDSEILTELCTLLHLVEGCDAFPRNQPFTRSGKIAFIDTEHVGMMKGHFIKHIVPALHPDQQDFATHLWKKLERNK